PETSSSPNNGAEKSAPNPRRKQCHEQDRRAENRRDQGRDRRQVRNRRDRASGGDLDQLSPRRFPVPVVRRLSAKSINSSAPRVQLATPQPEQRSAPTVSDRSLNSSGF